MLQEAFPGYAWKIKIKPSDCSSYLEIALVAKRISRKLLTELSLSWGVEIPRRTREWLHLLATWCQQLQAIRASVVFRVQCETYFNERAAMESRWYEGREKERRGRGGEKKGEGAGDEMRWLARDRGGNVRGGAAGCWGQDERRSLKWKCHWRKVKVINGIRPSDRVNSMPGAIVAAKRDTRTYTKLKREWGEIEGRGWAPGPFLKSARRVSESQGGEVRRNGENCAWNKWEWSGEEKREGKLEWVASVQRDAVTIRRRVKRNTRNFFSF